MTKNLIYYTIAFMIVLSLKLLYTQATNDTVLFILKPVSELVSLVSGEHSIYDFNTGFYFQNLNIVIDKSCSGVNFLLISFMLCLGTIVANRQTNFQKIVAFPVAILLAYSLTLFANTSRILISISTQDLTRFNKEWLHQAQGVFVYLSFLILFNLLINYLLHKYNSRHAKLT